MYSLWEKQSFLSADVLIIGAGITGLSAAASLKEKDAKLNIVVLERGILPTGASTKNAGFACFGSTSELLNDIHAIGEKAMVQLVEKRWNGLQKTRNRLGERAIDLQIKSGYELIFEQKSSTISEIDSVNNLLYPLFNKKVFELTNPEIKKFQFGKTQHLIENKLEGQLDTGKLISSLWKYCSSLGIRMHTGCEVLDIKEEDNVVKVMSKETIFSTKKLGVCTNAFTTKLVPDEVDIKPGRGIVMSIIPTKKLPFEGTFHYDDGFYYFRDYYGKLLFGGGRNLDLDGEETAKFGVSKKIKEKLIEDLNTIIIPNHAYEIEMEWSGIMAFGKTKQPIVKMVSDRIAMGVRLGGMGVAIGSIVGEEVADLLVV